MQVEKSLGRKPKELEGAPELRKELHYLWSIFLDLYSPDSGKVSYQELREYANVHGELSGFEIGVIRRLCAIKG